jgi:hypothetical protein
MCFGIGQIKRDIYRLPIKRSYIKESNGIQGPAICSGINHRPRKSEWERAYVRSMQVNVPGLDDEIMKLDQLEERRGEITHDVCRASSPLKRLTCRTWHCCIQEEQCHYLTTIKNESNDRRANYWELD